MSIKLISKNGVMAIEKPTEKELKTFFEVLLWVERKWEYEPEFPHCYNCSHQDICKHRGVQDDTAIESKRISGFLKARYCASYNHIKVK